MQFYSQKLKELRKNSKLSINFIVEEMGICRRTYWLWENGRRIPPEKSIRALAGIFNSSVNQISDLKPDIPISKVSLDKAYLENLAHSPQICRDIIQSIYKMEEQFRQSDIIAKTILSSIKAAFYIKDINLRYIKVNEYFKEIYNLPDDQSYIGRIDAAFFSKKEAEENSKEDEEVLRGKTIQSKEGYMPGTRRKRWALISKYPVLDHDLKISGIVGAFVDITESKEKQATNIILKKAIDHINECIWIGHEENGNIKLEYINDAIASLTGFTKEEALSESYIHLNTMLPEYIEKFHAFAINKSYPKSLIFKIKRKGDNKVLVLKETIYSHEGLKFGVITDVTNL